MKPRLLFALAAGLSAAYVTPAHAKIIRSVENSFAARASGVIRVETEGGNISVTPSADGFVRIIARETFRADTDSAADAVQRHLRLSIGQHGEEVTASAHYGAPTLGFHLGFWPPVQVDFVVTVPPGFSAELSTSGGSVTVGDLAGPVHAHTSGGDIVLGKLDGKVDASTSGGNVSLGEGDGPVNLRTSGGQITVGRAAGPTELSTSGGNVEVEAVENTLHASTSGGDMRAGVFGGLRGDCELKTSGGTVRVTVDRETSFKLDASTSGGIVSADGLTITIEKGGLGRSRLAGDVNGGGPLLRLHSSGGDVVVETRRPQ